MKIVMVSRYPEQPEKPRGGVESVTVNLATSLAGINEGPVQVVTLEHETSRLGDVKIGEISVRRLSRSKWPMILDLKIGPSRRRLAAALKDLGPSIVHFHETWGLGAVPTPCPQIFTVHGFDSANVPAERGRFSWIRSKLWSLVEKEGFAQAKNIISISPYVTQQIRPHTKATIHEIDNPVDLDFFSVERNEEAGRILCVGWISPRKNTLTSVRAFAKAFAAGHARKLVIAGAANDSEYLAKVQAEIMSAGLADSVEFAGQLNRQQLKKQLSLASVLLLPSLQENAPMAVSEAMAAGVPVITSNRCGMPYMVEDNNSGFLVEPMNEEQIAERLNRLLASCDLRRSTGARSREIAKMRFHPSEVAQKTMHVYQSAIEQRCQSRNGLTLSQPGWNVS